jgi:hypothetical protein
VRKSCIALRGACLGVRLFVSAKARLVERCRNSYFLFQDCEGGSRDGFTTKRFELTSCGLLDFWTSAKENLFSSSVAKFRLDLRTMMSSLDPNLLSYNLHRRAVLTRPVEGEVRLKRARTKRNTPFPPGLACFMPIFCIAACHVPSLRILRTHFCRVTASASSIKTLGSSPTTHASCPGCMIATSPGPNSISVPSFIRMR